MLWNLLILHYIGQTCHYPRTTRIYLDGRVLRPITKPRPSSSYFSILASLTLDKVQILGLFVHGMSFGPTDLNLIKRFWKCLNLNTWILEKENKSTKSWLFSRWDDTRILEKENKSTKSWLFSRWDDTWILEKENKSSMIVIFHLSIPASPTLIKIFLTIPTS